MADFQVKLRSFESQVMYFNGMYKLPVAPFPTASKIIQQEQQRKAAKLSDRDAISSRLHAFAKTLRDELNEVSDIVIRVQTGQMERKGADGEIVVEAYTEMDFLTDMADWLGDIQVYCASEMVKYGLPVQETLRIIMSSNFSKLDADGKPLYDEHGKVLKGPMYWKPEPQIKQMLMERVTEVRQPGIVWRADETAGN